MPQEEFTFGSLVEDDLRLPEDMGSCIADKELYSFSFPFLLGKASVVKEVEGQVNRHIHRCSQAKGVSGG